MTPATPEDRLATVASHGYTIQGIADAFEAIAAMAHLSERSDLGFMVGFMTDRLRQEADAVLMTATGHKPARNADAIQPPVPPAGGQE